MDIRITYNGTDITNHVISYDRVQQICTGIGSLSVTLDGSCNIDFDPYGELILHEADVKVGTYYLNRYERSEGDYTILLDANDASKKLKDYFIADTYENIGFEEDTKYWIRKFCDEMEITISYDRAGDGHPISNNTTLGMMSAYDQILELCQMSGWYFWFDAENVIHIGTTRRKINGYEYYFDSSNTLEVSISTDDKMLRNRAVVWGNGDPSTGGWIFSDLSVDVPWQYGPGDKRAVVISNSSIKTNQAAFDLGMIALKEFGKLTDVKTIVTPGTHEIYLGELCRVKTTSVNTIGFVTSIASSMSSGGLVTTITLDERCPRLFGYFSLGDYVYVSTMGSGVWRKYIDHNLDWENVSAGLDDLFVTDLYKRDDLMSCVTKSGLAYYSSNVPSGLAPGKVPSGVENAVYWKEIPYSSYSFIPDTVYSGYEFSTDGLRARAVCHHTGSNIVKLAVDNFPQDNSHRGDTVADMAFGVEAQLVTSGYVLASGFVGSSYVVDFNTASNKIEDFTPIILPGGSKVQRVVDIANDGHTDFVSVLDLDSGGYNLKASEWQYTEFSTLSSFKDTSIQYSRFSSSVTAQPDKIMTFDYKNFRGIVWIGGSTLSAIYYVDEMKDAQESYSVTIADETPLFVYPIDKYTHSVMCRNITTGYYSIYRVGLLYGSYQKVLDIEDNGALWTLKLTQVGPSVVAVQRHSPHPGYYTYLTKHIINLITTSYTTETVDQRVDGEIIITTGTSIIDISKIFPDDFVFYYAIRYFSITGKETFELLRHSHRRGTSLVARLENVEISNVGYSCITHSTNPGYSSAKLTINTTGGTKYYRYDDYTNVFDESDGTIPVGFDSDLGVNLRISGSNIIDANTGSIIFAIPAGHTRLTRLDSDTANLVTSVNSQTSRIRVFDMLADEYFDVTGFPSYGQVPNRIISNNFIIHYHPLYNTIIDYITNNSPKKAYKVLAGKVLRRSGDFFENIHTTSPFVGIEASQNYPIVTFNDAIGQSEVIQNFGTPNIIPNAGSGSLSKTFNGVYTNTDVFGDLETTYLFSTTSGVQAGRVVASGLQNVLEISDTVFVPSGGHTIFVETSNFEMPNQYIFTAVSGLGSYEFYQKDPTTESSFVKHSLKFPQHYITKIRLDDRI